MERLTAEDMVMLWPDEVWPQEMVAWLFSTASACSTQMAASGSRTHEPQSPGNYIAYPDFGNS